MPCPLCALIKGDVKSKWHIETDYFLVVDCITCRVPMAVLKRHDTKMADEERMDLEAISRIFHDRHMRTEMREIPEHLHVHFE